MKEKIDVNCKDKVLVVLHVVYIPLFQANTDCNYKYTFSRMYRDVATEVPKPCAKLGVGMDTSDKTCEDSASSTFLHLHVHDILPQAVLLDHWGEHCEVKI